MTKLHKAAKKLNVPIPITITTDQGKAFIKTIAVDCNGVSIGYQLLGIVREIKIEGTLV